MISRFNNIVFYILVACTLFLTSTANAGTTSYVYDELNRLKQVWYDQSSYIEYSYDELGNLLGKSVHTVASDPVAPVSIASPVGGVFDVNKTVTLSCSDVGTICKQIYYTIDGSVPTTASPLYDYPLLIAETTTLKYFAVDISGNAENPNTQTYTILTSGTPHVRIAGKGDFTSLQDAYDAAVTGDTLKVLGQSYIENLSANRAIAVTVDGGYSADYSANSGETSIYGQGHLYSGSIKFKNIRIRY